MYLLGGAADDAEAVFGEVQRVATLPHDLGRPRQRARDVKVMDVVPFLHRL